MEAAAHTPEERRQFERYDVDVLVTAHADGRTIEARSVDMSEGGMCLQTRDALPEGTRVQLEMAVPGTDVPARLEGKICWSRPRGSQATRCGVEFFGGMRNRAVKVLAVSVVTMAPLAANAADSVPSFDPQADMNLDGYEGGKRPDEIQVQSAFEQTFGEIDVCVEKARKSKPLPGDAHLSVLLDPEGERPLGVNAELAKPLTKNKKLNDCLRLAAAHAHYPSYDGPPVVVDFEFELDPGFVEE